MGTFFALSFTHTSRFFSKTANRGQAYILPHDETSTYTGEVQAVAWRSSPSREHPPTMRSIVVLVIACAACGHREVESDDVRVASFTASEDDSSLHLTIQLENSADRTLDTYKNFHRLRFDAETKTLAVDIQVQPLTDEECQAMGSACGHFFFSGYSPISAGRASLGFSVPKKGLALGENGLQGISYDEAKTIRMSLPWTDKQLDWSEVRNPRAELAAAERNRLEATIQR